MWLIFPLYKSARPTFCSKLPWLLYHQTFIISFKQHKAIYNTQLNWHGVYRNLSISNFMLLEKLRSIYVEY